MNLSQARQAAKAEAISLLQDLYGNSAFEILEDWYAETEDCWMFFNNRAIFIPPERALSNYAYVYSKHTNEGRLVPDYWDNRPKLNEYLALISGYFAKGAHAG